MTEFSIIPEEEIVSKRDTNGEVQRKYKGLIDIGTYNQLKGILDTSKIVIEKIPLTDKKIHEIEYIRHLDALASNSLSILENARKISRKPHLIKVERTSSEIDTIVKDLIVKFDYAKKLTNVCDHKSLKVVSDIDNHLIKYKDLSKNPTFKKVSLELKKLTNDFDTHCVCMKRNLFEREKKKMRESEIEQRKKKEKFERTRNKISEELEKLKNI